MPRVDRKERVSDEQDQLQVFNTEGSALGLERGEGERETMSETGKKRNIQFLQSFFNVETIH